MHAAAEISGWSNDEANSKPLVLAEDCAGLGTAGMALRLFASMYTLPYKIAWCCDVNPESQGILAKQPDDT